jgi:hypothetical protein
MAIAAPLLAECKPISEAVYPRESGPKTVTIKRRRFKSLVPVNNAFAIIKSEGVYCIGGR